jgi:hypothetical protein
MAAVDAVNSKSKQGGSQLGGKKREQNVSQLGSEDSGSNKIE